MTLISSKGEKELVRVKCDYTYTPKDAEESVSIKVGEEYQLLNKTNNEWWFVQKSDAKTRFFIPAQYVEISKAKNPVPKPKPRISKSSSSDEKKVEPRVDDPSSPSATLAATPALEPDPKQSMKRTSLLGGTASQVEELSPSILPPDGVVLAGQKISAGNAVSPRISKMASEDEALNQLESVLEAEDTQQSTERQIDQTGGKTDKGADKKKVNEADGKADEKAVKSNPVESTNMAKIASNPHPEVAKTSPVAAKKIESRGDDPSSPSAVPAPPLSPEAEPDEINYVNLDDYQQMVKERVSASTTTPDNRADSETSDYRSGDSKGGSRESLDDSKSCDTDSVGTKEDLEKSEPARRTESPPTLTLPPKSATIRPVASNTKRSEYENLEIIQKSIRDRSEQSKTLDVSDGSADRSSVVDLPKGWVVEGDKGEKIFVNVATGDKWRAASDGSGRKYFYNPVTSQTVWSLNEASKSDRSSRAEAKVDQSVADLEVECPASEPLPLKMVQKQGPLSKAKVDDQGKKPKKPSWSQSFAILVENMVYFYKDQKVASGAKVKSMSSLGKPELILQLDGAMVSSSPDEKKKEILVLSLSSGVVYYLHNENEETLQHWKQSFENNIEAVKTVPLTDSKEIENLPVRPDAIFGSSLTTICEREKTKVPRFVHSCIAAVEKRGLDVDGIYRISGNMSLVQKLRLMVDQNEFYDLHDSSWDVHTITGALKLFFRELSEPVFTFALFDEFLSAFRITDRTQKIQAYRDVIKKMPPFHAETMKKLFKHLAEVIRHGHENRMQPQALAIVFGPTLLWPEAKNKDVTLAASMVYQGQVVEFMMVECRLIFS